MVKKNVRSMKVCGQSGYKYKTVPAIRNDTMEAIDHITPFLGDADMIGLVCNNIRKLFCMCDEGYEVLERKKK